ncbi:GNAT family N-acetyltransferase [Oceanobacter mangrovi]|uniref:GNAT family N-acetyltransferase n=1 Tax=Oceanobacter mangrovi TaxID=2862510 RepID=UPI001C8DF06E|nr:GNAT family N-acetyltransferase [Oceanobacter mangrovi]
MSVTAIQTGHWADIMEIQQHCYREVEPESLQALQSKWHHSPHCCFTLLQNDKPQAYLLAHEWSGEQPPKLNKPLAAKAADPAANAQKRKTQWYLHDLAISPSAAGKGIGRRMVEHFLQQAEKHRCDQVLLVSVQDSAGFWQKFGFEEQPDNPPCDSYGEQAVTMKLEM